MNIFNRDKELLNVIKSMEQRITDIEDFLAQTFNAVTVMGERICIVESKEIEKEIK
jgi:hypothetical protein